MKILLINHHDIGNINTRLPKSLNKAQGVYPPLGIAYIAAVLEQRGYDVSILDSKALNLTAEETKNQMLRKEPDIVGVTAMSSTVKGALEAAKMAKEIGATVVIGGPQLSAHPKETLSYDFIDYGVVGEGEYTMLELAQAIENGVDVKEIKGLVYKRNGKTIVNEDRIVDNLDDLPYPARHLLPMEKYHCVITATPFTTIISSRGCPYKCGFCYKHPSDKKVRWRNPKNVVDEMEHLIENYRIKETMFYDDTIAIRRKHMVGICNEIINRGLDTQWESPVRVDNVDEELLKLMHKAGCIRLRYGVESGDEGILKLMRKETPISRTKKVFEWTKNAGIETFAYFIIGYATETTDTIRKTINFAKELDPDWVMFTTATPYPHTNLYELAEEEGLVEGDYWGDFTLGKRDDRLPYFVNDAEKWVRNAYKEFYLRPRFVLKKLWKMRSLDTMRKYIRGGYGIVFFEMK